MAVVAIPTLAPGPEDPAYRADLLFEGGMEDFTAQAFLDWLDRPRRT
jgi:hypothetical protein